MRNHTKLKVFHLADRLAMRTYEVTRSFPTDERFGLTSQLRRAAVSVAANIVEGAARPSRHDYARLLAIAYGSVRELEYELSIAHRLGLLNPSTDAEIRDLASQTGRALRALIVAIRGPNLGQSTDTRASD
jgi:four helix bundle protein